MTHEDFLQLLTVLMKIADKPYSLTGASDWGMLVALVSLFGIIFMGMLGIIWHDLRGAFQEHKVYDDKAHDSLWDAHRDCQERCCPTLVKHREVPR